MSTWKKVIVICATAVLAAVVLLCVYLQDQTCFDTIRLTAGAADGVTQSVRLYKDGNAYYAFLPAFADPDDVQIDYAAGCALYLDDVPCGAGSTVRLSPGQSYSLRMRGTFGFASGKQTLVVMQAGNVPALSIRLTDGTLHDIQADEEVSRTGVASLVLSDRTVDFSGSFNKLHGRGNTSWTQFKKSYTLLFREPVDLLGMGAGKSWVLVSNVFDESGLRNKLVYDTAKAIGVRYAVDCEYVDLYIDGEYQGLYLLAERVDVGAGRVDITDLAAQTQAVNYKSLSGFTADEEQRGSVHRKYYDIPNDPADITGGYLLQIEHHNGMIAQEESYFEIPGLSFIISSPKYASRRQAEYVSNLIDRTQTAIASGDLSAIDLDSFVNYYLIQELFANTDESSFYFCKDSDRIDPKIYACAIWDFDLSIGSTFLSTDYDPRVLTRNTSNWFDLLYRDPVFFEALQAQYAHDVRPNVQTLLYDRLAQYAEEIDRSFLMDKARWRSSFGADFAANQSQRRFDTIGEHVEYISQFLSSRVSFLDSVWTRGENNAYHSIGFVFHGDKTFVRYHFVPDGSASGEAPDPQDPLFTGWFDADGSAYDPDRIVLQNEYYVGRVQASGAPAAQTSPLRRVPQLVVQMLKILTREDGPAAAGLGVIVCALGGFVLWDGIKIIRKRRCRHGRRR